MFPPVADSVAEKIGSMYKIAVGEAKAAAATRSACARAIDCSTGKPGGKLFWTVRSTVTRMSRYWRL